MGPSKEKLVDSWRMFYAPDAVYVAQMTVSNY